jgi:hypothetical protein
MRRSVPLVIVAEDHRQFVTSIGMQLAIDATFLQFDSNTAHLRANPLLVTPFTHVTLVICSDVARHLPQLDDAVAASKGQLSVVRMPPGATPTIMPQTYQLSVPTAGDGNPPPTLVRFSTLCCLSERLHEAMSGAADSPTLVDVVQMCEAFPDVSRDAILNRLAEHLHQAATQHLNLWLDRKFHSAVDAGTRVGDAMRKTAAEVVDEMRRARGMAEHWNGTAATQLGLFALLFAATAALQFATRA